MGGYATNGAESRMSVRGETVARLLFVALTDIRGSLLGLKGCSGVGAAVPSISDAADSTSPQPTSAAQLEEA